MKRVFIQPRKANLPRIIGYVGIALLTPIAAFGLVTAFTNRDWYGLLLMVGFVVLLVFFVRNLRAAAHRESDPALKAASNLGWYGEPISALFLGFARRPAQTDFRDSGLPAPCRFTTSSISPMVPPATCSKLATSCHAA
jgi:hypothetical protein